MSLYLKLERYFCFHRFPFPSAEHILRRPRRPRHHESGHARRKWDYVPPRITSLFMQMRGRKEGGKMDKIQNGRRRVKVARLRSFRRLSNDLERGRVKKSLSFLKWRHQKERAGWEEERDPRIPPFLTPPLKWLSAQSTIEFRSFRTGFVPPFPRARAGAG